MKAGMIVALAALLILILAAVFYAGTSASDTGANRQYGNATSVDFIAPGGQMATAYVEIADTPQEREQGLMYRTSMDEDKGMLFIFDAERPQSFWMKNTAIPLDMVFINSRGGIVDINYNATPYSESIFTPRQGCKYVVEVNGGFCRRHGIGVGDLVKIHLSPTP